jgi:hypothetical protein
MYREARESTIASRGLASTSSNSNSNTNIFLMWFSACQSTAARRNETPRATGGTILGYGGIGIEGGWGRVVDRSSKEAVKLSGSFLFNGGVPLSVLGMDRNPIGYMRCGREAGRIGGTRTDAGTASLWAEDALRSSSSPNREKSMGSQPFSLLPGP